MATMNLPCLLPVVSVRWNTLLSNCSLSAIKIWIIAAVQIQTTSRESDGKDYFWSSERNAISDLDEDFVF